METYTEKIVYVTNLVYSSLGYLYWKTYIYIFQHHGGVENSGAGVLDDCTLSDVSNGNWPQVLDKSNKRP